MKKYYILVLILSVLAITSLFALNSPQTETIDDPPGTVPAEKSIEPLPGRSPTVIIKDKDGKPFKLSVRDLAVDVKVVGSIAVTTIDITFLNTMPEILIGELNFPLSEGQTISRFAMDLNGKLREGVVIEKAKGRRVFESVVRKRIDPALLEMTRGNSFKSRVYPIPANGTKRIVIAFEEELREDKEGMVYRLPLLFEDKLENFRLNAVVYNQLIKPDASNSLLKGVEFQKKDNSFATVIHYKDFIANRQFEFSLPSPTGQAKAYIEERDGKDYFLVNVHPEIQSLEKVLPDRVCILYDVSSSTSHKDSDKENAVLEGYFSKIGNCNVELVLFSNTVEKSETYRINSGNWDALKKRLAGLRYDGGTQLGAIDLKKYDCDEFLLLTDGISNFGEKEIKLSDKPVIAINSSQSAEHSYLNYIAQATGGQYINLMKLSTRQAVKTMASIPFSFISATSNNVSDLFPGITTPVRGKFSITGVLLNDETELTLNFGFGSHVTHRETIVLSKDEMSSNSGLVPRVWAQKKLAELDMRFEQNMEKITALGKEFSIVTRNTSLIILDRIEDYVMHRIVPPEKLQDKYFEMITKINDRRQDDSTKHFKWVVDMFEKRVEWWKKEFDQSKVKEEVRVLTGDFSAEYGSAIGGIVNSVSRNGTSSDANALESGSANANGREGIRALVGRSQIRSSRTNETQIRIDGVNISNDFTGTFVRANSYVPITSMPELTSSTSFVKNKPRTEYYKELEETDDLPETYFELKKKYGKMPLFYLDAADVAANKGEKEFGLRILSNIAELKLEDHQLLRVLGHRLRQLGYINLAIAIFEDVLKIREEEPQTFRDLGLAYADDGRYQKACDMLYEVVTKKWDNRFPEIELIVLNEMNNIIAKSKNSVNTEKYDDRFLVNMPVHIRVVLDWDADNCDIDLWVTDLHGEKCYYSHPNTNIGGHISRDFTGGYGPETFLLKKAIGGKYTIQANYFGSRQQRITGPTVIQLKLYTKYGSDDESLKEITLSLKEKRQVINIGEFEFSELNSK